MRDVHIVVTTEEKPVISRDQHHMLVGFKHIARENIRMLRELVTLVASTVSEPQDRWGSYDRSEDFIFDDDQTVDDFLQRLEIDVAPS